MGKKTKPFIVEMQAEGLREERRLIRKETHEEAKKLAAKMPTFGPDRLMYIRNLYTRALRKEIDKEVFKEFIRVTNSYQELQQVEARARLVSKKGGTRQR